MSPCRPSVIQFTIVLACREDLAASGAAASSSRTEPPPTRSGAFSWALISASISRLMRMARPRACEAQTQALAWQHRLSPRATVMAITKCRIWVTPVNRFTVVARQTVVPVGANQRLDGQRWVNSKEALR